MQVIVCLYQHCVICQEKLQINGDCNMMLMIVLKDITALGNMRCLKFCFLQQQSGIYFVI